LEVEVEVAEVVAEKIQLFQGEVEVVEVEEERLSLTSQFRQHLVKH
jgi:hypothetical protein